MTNWKVWDDEKSYGELFYKRAIGELPEMESSKALAKILLPHTNDNDFIADIGCGGGHYLRSLDNQINHNFNYIGIDQTEHYISKAKVAFNDTNNTNKRRQSTKFMVGDIFQIPLKDNEVDIAMCNNVLLHLPSIERPISELIRIAKRKIIIRSLIGEHTLRIKQVHKPEEFDENGEPNKFHFHNIYSKGYIEQLLSKHNLKNYTFILDLDFNSNAFNTNDNFIGERPENLTYVLNGMQINTYIIQPWTFLIIEK
jgi:ubiquinone/menaquinone biosynthesis C-methylase UbiE